MDGWLLRRSEGERGVRAGWQFATCKNKTKKQQSGFHPSLSPLHPFINVHLLHRFLCVKGFFFLFHLFTFGGGKDERQSRRVMKI